MSNSDHAQVKLIDYNAEAEKTRENLKAMQKVKFANAAEEEEAVKAWHEYDNAKLKEISDYCKAMMHAPSRELASLYVAPLLSEGILSVSPQAVRIMGLTVPRTRLALFYMALHYILAGVEGEQGPRGYTYTNVTLVHGNETTPGYKIASNIDSEGSILLTRQIASELYEIILYFTALDNNFFETVASDDIFTLGFEA